MPEFFVRLKPYSPRLGFSVQRLHAHGTLFQGGDRPTWYKVRPEMLDELSKMVQDSGAPMFDIVSADEKSKIDSIDTARQAAALGIAAAVVAQPINTTPVDLTAIPERKPQMVASLVFTPQQQTQVPAAQPLIAPVGEPVAPGWTTAPAREVAIPEASTPSAPEAPIEPVATQPDAPPTTGKGRWRRS